MDGEEYTGFVDMLKLLFCQQTSPHSQNRAPLNVLVTREDDKYPHDPSHLGAFFHMPILCAIYRFKISDDDRPLN
jgi:hypothetical protein